MMNKEMKARLDQVQEFIRDSVEGIQIRGIPVGHIRIWMPLYFNKILMEHMVLSWGYMPEKMGVSIIDLYGVKVLEGYEHKVIVAHVDAVIFPMDPIVLQIS